MGGEIVSDLFGEDSYFTSAADFWTAQMAAVEDRAQAYRDAGWRDVVILERGAYFHAWEHERRAVLGMLGFDPVSPTVVDGDCGHHGVPGLFLHLMTLPEDAVLDVLTIVMGETLAAGSEIIDLRGVQLGVKRPRSGRPTTPCSIMSATAK